MSNVSVHHWHGVPVYRIGDSVGSSEIRSSSQLTVPNAFTSGLPTWMLTGGQRHSEHDPKAQKIVESNRIELVQDFSFPTASYRVVSTPDGKHVYATGVYKPSIRCWELAEVSLKFERYQDTENVDFVCLDDDWTKFATLQVDRSLQFHVRGGVHYNIRIPVAGRQLHYNPRSCELLAVGASAEGYRFNLHRGQFLAPYETSLGDSINAVEVCQSHQLVAFAASHVDFFDPRNRTRVSTLSIPADSDVSAISFDRDEGMLMAVGTEKGQLFLYDIRNRKPLMTKEFGYDEPVKRVTFAESSAYLSKALVAADSRGLRVYDLSDQSLHASLEPPSSINDMLVYPSSGLIILACEQPQLQTYYIPSLGPAPQWCSFLDNLTEELSVAPRPAFHDNYKFLTIPELRQLDVDRLIGSPVLRPYMHGFFIDARLYNRIISGDDPFHRGGIDRIEKIQMRSSLEAETASRVKTACEKLEMMTETPGCLKPSGYQHERGADRSCDSNGHADASQRNIYDALIRDRQARLVDRLTREAGGAGAISMERRGAGKKRVEAGRPRSRGRGRGRARGRGGPGSSAIRHGGRGGSSKASPARRRNFRS